MRKGLGWQAQAVCLLGYMMWAGPAVEAVVALTGVVQVVVQVDMLDVVAMLMYIFILLVTGVICKILQVLLVLREKVVAAVLDMQRTVQVYKKIILVMICRQGTVAVLDCMV
jgi:hypothetical protein